MKFVVLSVLTLVAATAFAVGDPPQHLNAREAKAYFDLYKNLLVPGCPGSQNITSGLITGGANPLSGSQRFTFNFDGGAWVAVVRHWDTLARGGGYANSSVAIQCSSK